jgi:hypothetical protein
MANKPKKPKKSDVFVHVEVLQNGAEVAHVHKPAKKAGVLALTSRDGHELSIPHYPLPDGRLEFLRCEHGHISLVVDHQWEGFCTTEGVLHNIAKGEKGKRVQALHNGDYGSISCNDLRIMVKVGPNTRPPPARAAFDKRFRGSFLNHFIRSKYEKIGFAFAAAAALVVFGGIVGGLERRPYLKPTKMSDINENYMLTFVSPDHLRGGPEALQQNLDRKHYVRSVLEFYQSFTQALMAWPGYEARFLYPTTISAYETMFAAARETIAAHIERQRAADHAQALVKDAGMPAIPAVVGETVAGSMLRVIDKIGILQDGLAMNLTAKRAIDQEFSKDPEYNWEEYRNVSSSRDDKMKEYLAKAKPFQVSSDEQLMYAEAERLAAAAAAKAPRSSDGRSSLSRRISADGHSPVGMPPGVRFASFLSDTDFLLLDEKLYHLQGSEYGPRRGRAPVVREPLAGEIDPNLVERFIKQNRFQLQLCYELALRRDEGATGTMEWKWRIDSRGLISDVALLSTTIKDPKMQTCIHRKISNWRFPRPRRGSVEISYPFEFAPTKG